MKLQESYQSTLAEKAWSITAFATQLSLSHKIFKGLVPLPLLRSVLFALGTAVLFGFAALFAIEMTLQSSGVAAIWPANGILLAAMLLMPQSKWRSITLGLCLIANLVVNWATGKVFAVSIGLTFANILEVIIAYEAFIKLSPAPLKLSNATCLKYYLLAAGCIAPFVSALIGSTIASAAYSSSFADCFQHWFLADALGLVIVTPAVVIICEPRPHCSTKPTSEYILLFAVVIATTLAVFSQSELPLLFLISPVLVYTACRLGPAFNAAATLAMSAIAVSYTAMGVGPAVLGAGGNSAVAMELVQLFIGVVFLTALPLANVMRDMAVLHIRLQKEAAIHGELLEQLRTEKEASCAHRAQTELLLRRLRDSIEILPDSIVMLDAEMRYVAWNKKYSDVYAEIADRLIVGGKLEDAMRVGIERGLYAEAVGREEQWLADRLNQLANPGPAHEQLLADGTCLLIQERRTSEGGLISLRTDITSMKQRESSLRLLFERNPLPMFVVCKSGMSILAANSAAVRHYGYDEVEILKLSFRDIQREELELSQVQEVDSISPPRSGGQCVQHVRRDGKVMDTEVYCQIFPHHGEPAVLIAAIDVTERRLADARANHLARHDPLTNLPNRNLLSEHMQRALARVKRGDRIALLLLDLDNFKAINDTLGHSAGDELLNVVADRLCHCIRETDTVARLGGDEFAILLIGSDLPNGAARVAQRIIDQVRRPIMLGTKEVTVGVSIGIAIAPDDAYESGDLFRYADLALYTAKDEQRGTYRFFQSAMDEKVRRRNTLESELRHAIDSGELEIHYQPILSVENARPICAEALVRWRHPVRGLIPPLEFIPIAEQTGMIVDIGAQVLRRACQEAVSWPREVSLAVNASAIELESGNLIANIRWALEESGLSGHRLQIEVTESTLMRDVERSRKELLEIEKLGVMISMDDFGTGYSSLSSLRSFPFGKIKIDRAFIKDLEASEEARAILGTIVSLAKTMGMQTTAEGIETAKQFQLAKDYGCSEVQGYLFYKPLPPEQLFQVLSNHQDDVRNESRSRKSGQDARVLPT